MSLNRKITVDTGTNCYFSSNDKVIHYLQNSTHSSSKSSFPMLHKSSTTDLFPVEHRLRSCSENDSISSSCSSSVLDSLSRSDFSTESSLSDPVARSSTISSNVSFDEDLDFSLGFDQINDEDDDDEKQQISNKNNADAITLHGESTVAVGIKPSEPYLRQSSNLAILNDNFSFDTDESALINYARQLQRTNFLHDSTYTLCSPDRFSAYTDADDDDENPEDDQRTSSGLRSNSLSVLQVDGEAKFIEKAPRKVVRFADMLGLDLESIRYMTPPDQSSNTLIQECVRLQLGQLRLSNNSSDVFSFFNRPTLPSPTKQYNLVSKNFICPTNIVPLIYERQVILECLYTKDSVVFGTIRVHNCSYDKNVFIRLTENEWETTNDIQAWHSMNYFQDNTDTFTFEIIFPKLFEEILSPKRILFAVCLQSMQQEFWDNNQGWNYVLDIFQKR